MAGPLTVAGSKRIFFTSIGREHPKHLAITIVRNIVIETNMLSDIVNAKISFSCLFYIVLP